jgi:hypothetical protein
MKYVPAAPGRHHLRFSAYLADQLVGAAEIDVEVDAAPVEEDPAKAKLRKLFGDR